MDVPGLDVLRGHTRLEMYRHRGKVGGYIALNCYIPTKVLDDTNTDSCMAEIAKGYSTNRK